MSDATSTNSTPRPRPPRTRTQTHQPQTMLQSTPSQIKTHENQVTGVYKSEAQQPSQPNRIYGEVLSAMIHQAETRRVVQRRGASGAGKEGKEDRGDGMGPGS
ncbi:hypothetical protein HDV00_002664 [Rhizophlyctis rosea]|nr:hypothetical protein HDV00_002664 [Rhizophlyctis rosea]